MSQDILGPILAITAALCWGTGAVFARLGLQRIKSSTGVFISMLSSLIMVGSLALIINFDDIASLQIQEVLWFALIGITNYVIGRQCNYAGIKYVGVTKATPVFSSAPLFAMILALAFLGEHITVPIVVGTLAIVGGIGLLVSSK